MKLIGKIVILSLVMLWPVMSRSQSRSTEGWIDYGSSHVNKWLQFSPQTMGPNALPVPAADEARIGDHHAIETGVHYHWMTGDTAINSFLRLYWNVVPRRVAIEIWGCPSETFHMTNTIRDQRQIYWDDTGWITHQGDLWISTYIQLLRDRAYWPDIVLNYSLKTTTGLSEHARYTDAPVNYFYLAFGKSFYFKSWIDELRLAGQVGFYVWQTNKVEVAQDEGPMFGVNLKLKKGGVALTSEFSGYSGYDAYQINGPAGQHNNDPLIMRTGIEVGTTVKGRFEVQTGFRNYPYQTLRLSFTYSF